MGFSAFWLDRNPLHSINFPKKAIGKFLTTLQISLVIRIENSQPPKFEILLHLCLKSICIMPHFEIHVSFRLILVLRFIARPCVLSSDTLWYFDFSRFKRFTSEFKEPPPKKEREKSVKKKKEDKKK